MSAPEENHAPRPGDRPTPLRAVKVVCTLGPASSEPGCIRELVRAGMDVARLNFSHGTVEAHRDRLHALREAAAAEGRPVAALQDLQGPKVRIGPVAAGTVVHAEGRFEIRRGREEGDASGVSVDDPLFFEEVERGDTLLLADGAVELGVRDAGPERLVCEVLAGGPLASGKGVVAPRGLLRRPILMEKDYADLAAGAELGFDAVCISYVRGAEDLRRVRRELARVSGRRRAPPLLAKIETASAVANLGTILDLADAVMVARGDLALETPFERVPLEQKRILEAARARGRPVITATQMLASMERERRPTRAEVNDVANAVLDGTDAVMLSEETAVGRHPALAAGTMARIVAATESGDRMALRGPEGLPSSLHAIGVMVEAACRVARALDARALLAWSSGGLAARLLARATPGIPILAPTERRETARWLALVRGVHPLPTEGPELDPEAVRALLGVGPGEDARLVVFGHELGRDSRRVPWIRLGQLAEPSAWSRDPRRER